MATRRRTTRFLAAVAVAAAGAACGGLGDATTTGGSALPFGSAADPRDATTTIEVETLDSMAFSPEEVTVERGDVVLFVVENTGKLPHELTIGDEAEQQRHAEEMSDPGMTAHDHPFSVLVAPGETKEIAWEFGEAGDFLYGCHVPGHYEAGMVGTITVR